MPDEHREMMTEKIKSVSVFYQERFQTVFMKGIQEELLNPVQVAQSQMIISSLVIGSIVRLANAKMELEENMIIENYIDQVYKTIIKISN
jgi:hypothetical protein